MNTEHSDRTNLSGFFMGFRFVYWDPLYAKRSCPKMFCYGLCENAWFTWQPPIYFSRMGVGLQIKFYLGKINAET